MAYNFKKDTCDRCGINKKDAPIVDTGINHPIYCRGNSFHLGIGGSVLCTPCHREKGLEDLFHEMDVADLTLSKVAYLLMAVD